MGWRRGVPLLALGAIFVSAISSSTREVSARPVVGPESGSPIKHIVVIFQENNSFDHVLGYLCVHEHRCDGATSGMTHDGKLLLLNSARDISPNVQHAPEQQALAVNRGRMNQFDLIGGCQAPAYRCYSQFTTPQPRSLGSIPNLATLARAFVISDRTFTNHFNASWVAHLSLVAATNAAFTGRLPHQNPDYPPGHGWGCDSYHDAEWISVDSDVVNVPSCIPAPDGSGPYRTSPVQWVPTIMDSLDQARISWRIYGRPTVAENKGASDYTLTVCPTFAECLNGPQQKKVVVTDQIYSDAANGTLAHFSLVLPKHDDSQHNKHSMLAGDNYIGRVVSLLMNGPDWDSTAIFITYDDCGCFYDHVPPPNGLGVRVPMVIVSPYAKPGYTDSVVASHASILAFTEHTFGLPPLNAADGSAYDYSQSFDFSQDPLPAIPLQSHPVPAWERRWIAAHPEDETTDPNW